MGECRWLINKGGGVGQRPAPGDIRTQGHSPPAFNLRGGPQAKVKKPRFLASPRSAAGRGLQPSGRTKGGAAWGYAPDGSCSLVVGRAIDNESPTRRSGRRSEARRVGKE